MCRLTGSRVCSVRGHTHEFDSFQWSMPLSQCQDNDFDSIQQSAPLSVPTGRAAPRTPSSSPYHCQCRNNKSQTRNFAPFSFAAEPDETTSGSEVRNRKYHESHRRLTHELYSLSNQGNIEYGNVPGSHLPEVTRSMHSSGDTQTQDKGGRGVVVVVVVVVGCGGCGGCGSDEALTTTCLSKPPHTYPPN